MDLANAFCQWNGKQDWAGHLGLIGWTYSITYTKVKWEATESFPLSQVSLKNIHQTGVASIRVFIVLAGVVSGSQQWGCVKFAVL